MSRLSVVLLMLVIGCGPGAAAPGDPDPGAVLPVQEHQKALEAFRAGRLEEAGSLWSGILTVDSGDGPALAGMIRIALRQEDLEEASRWAGLAEGKAPEDGTALVARGEVLLRRGRLEEAGARFMEALGREPEEARAWLGLGRVRLASFQTRSGLAAMKRAFRLDPDDPEVIRRHAEVLARREDLIAELSRYLTLAEGEPEEYRQSARETIGFYRALGDTPLWVAESVPARVEMRLRSVIARPGTVGGYLVSLRLNGQRSIRCLLDTGAVGLHLSPSTARKLGLESVSGGTVFGGGGDQAHETFRALAGELSLGDLRFRNAVVQVAERELDPTGRYSGILGVERLAGYRIELDLKRRTLLLVRWPQEGPVPESKEEEVDPAVAPPTRMPGPGESLLFDIDGQLLIEALAHRGQVARPVLLLVDTGAARTYLDQAVAAELGPIRGPHQRRTVRSYGGQAPSGGTLADLRIEAGPLEAANLTLPLLDLGWRARLGGVNVDGYLGLDLLKGRKLVLDLRRGTARFD